MSRTPTEDRIRHSLRRTAAELDVPPGDMARLQRSADRHARRARRTTAAVALVAVTVGAVGAWSLLDPTPQVELAAGHPPPAITWTAEPHVLAGLPTPQIVQGPDGLLYALSTAPDQRIDDGVPDQSALYRSADGSSWQRVSDDAMPRLATLDVTADGLLYGVTTAPGGVVQVAASHDGMQWDTTDLDATIDPPQVTDGVELLTLPTSITVAASETTRIVTVTQPYRIDDASVLDAEERRRAYTSPTADGLAVMPLEAPVAEPGGEGAPTAPPTAPPPAPRRVIPWAELGLDGVHDLAVTHTVVSRDGGSWEPLATVDGQPVRAVVPSPDGFVAVLTEPAPATVHVATSSDGTTWTTAPTHLADAAEVLTATTTPDGIIVVTRTGTDIRVHTSTDGRAWTTHDPAATLKASGLDAVVGQPAVGPLGVLMPVTALTGPGGQEQRVPEGSGLLFSADGTDFSLLPADSISDGMTRIVWVAVGADRLLVDADTPDGRRTFVGIPR